MLVIRVLYVMAGGSGAEEYGVGGGRCVCVCVLSSSIRREFQNANCFGAMPRCAAIHGSCCGYWKTNTSELGIGVDGFYKSVSMYIVCLAHTVKF